MTDIYNRYSTYLKSHYGCKVYKLPVSIPVSCPNRGNGLKGCTYCDEKGAGFDNLSGVFSVREQIKVNMEYIGKKYKAEKFIAYFQNFTNTFLPVDQFRKYMLEACQESIVEVSVSTRPDCIRKEYIDVMEEISSIFGVEITVELGLQSVNPHTLNKINRGHTLAEFIEAAGIIKNAGFNLCAHMILNLPWDNITDAVEAAKILSVLNVDFVKLHSLYIPEGTEMAEEYKNGLFEVCSLEEYSQRVTEFLRHLTPKAYVERIVSRAPEEGVVFANWNRSSWYIRDYIENKMRENRFYQGQLFNYLGGASVRRFFD